MTEQQVKEIWDKILEMLADKLQFGFLEQAGSIASTKIRGNELILTVASEEAKAFFNSEVNQQRLILLTRPLINLETVTAVMVDEDSDH